MKKYQYFYMFIALLSNISLTAQSDLQSIQYEKDNVLFTVSCPAHSYHLGDTIIATFTISNRSGEPIYIINEFDDNIYSLRRKEINLTYGSRWYNKLGWSFDGLIEIRNKHKYSKTLFIAIKQDTISLTKQFDEFDNYPLYIGVAEVRKIHFAAAFFKQDRKNKLHFTEYKKGEQLLYTFKIFEDGFYVEDNLNRFSIGILEIKIARK